jgi:hypothetical protein
MTDEMLDERIRERFALPTRSVGEVPEPLVKIRERVVRRRYRRRVVARATTIGCVVGLLVAVSLVAVTRGSSRSLKIATNPTRPVSGLSSIVTDPNGVDVLPAPPLTARPGSAVAWTGHELVVWGGTDIDSGAGNSALTDGAAYDPTTRKWRMMRPSPLPGSSDPAVAVMTKSGLVVVRGSATALWDPDTNEWRRLDDAPVSCSPQCWRTGPIFDLNAVGRSVVSYSANAVLDVQTGRWTILAQPPRHFERFTAASTSNELVVIGGDSSPTLNTEALAFDRTTMSWQKLPAPPRLNQQAIAATRDGTRIVAVDYDMNAVSYNPATRTWTELARLPARFSEWTPFIASTSGRPIVLMANAVVTQQANGPWIPVPYGQIPRVISAVASTVLPDGTDESNAVFVLGSEAQHLTVVAVDPAKLASHPPLVQVGLTTARVPEHFTVAATSSDPGGFREAVHVTIRNTRDGNCDLTSAYGTQPDPTEKQLVRIPTADRTADWYRSTDALTWEVATTESDTLTIHCSDAATSETIARSVTFDTPNR